MTRDRVVLAINDPQLSGQAAALAQEGEELELVEEFAELDRLVRGLHRVEADVIVLHDTRGAVPVLELAREISGTFPELAIVLVLSDPGSEHLRTAMQAGARDVVALPLALEELQHSIRSAAAWGRSMRERVSGEWEAATATGLSGRVVAIAGAKGGVGTTTLAIHLALHLAGASDRRLCLVEFDLQAGDFRSLLDLPYRRSISELAGVSEELSVRHLDDTLYGHPSGLRVLLAPEEGEQAEDVTAAVARNVVAALRARHDLTIIDLGAWLSEAGAAACELADDVIIVTTPDVPALRGVQRLIRMWDRLQVAVPRPRVVLNQASRRREVQTDLARQVVGDALCATTVPADFASLESAINTGTPERLEDRKLRSAIAALADELELRGEPGAQADDDAPPERPKSLVARLTGERGQSTVETLGILPIVALIALTLWQMGLIGYSYMASGHAAREGARALAVGEDVQPRIREDLPGAWRGDMRCVVGDSRVRVSVSVPAVLPGLDTPFRISSSAGTSSETEAVGEVQEGLREPRKRSENDCAPKKDEDSDEEGGRDPDA